MKEYLDNLKNKYETKDFIKDDPIQFPHLFKNDLDNLEIMGFLASLFAFGKREQFILKLNLFLKISNHNPKEFILNIDKNEEKLKGFIYRFYKDSDIISLLYILREFLIKYETIGNLFYEKRNNDPKILIQNIYDEIQSSKYNPKTQGFSFMIANPKKGGANKRMNMFLRWMIRGGEVDLGVWDFIDKKDLIIPLDVHVGNISRGLNLLKRKQNDSISAWELTQKLKEFNPDDPIGYDFALFGAGVNKENSQVLLQI